PMIRIIQSNNLMLVDKFYAIKNITLPAWKNQISLAISLNEQKNSVQLANTIDDATNDLLKRNADLLHQNSVDTAKANQRSVIDIETLE
ncbi:toxic anion resistance protein, partial [bacterium LRH843]|nr:toxic anion resistance protein [bacterium LRH843]